MATKKDWAGRIADALPCKRGWSCYHDNLHKDCDARFRPIVLTLLREFAKETAGIARHKGCTNAGCDDDDHGPVCPCGIANRIESMFPAKKEG